MSSTGRIRMLFGALALAAAASFTCTMSAHAATATVQFAYDSYGYCNSGYAGWPYTVNGVTGWFECNTEIMQVTWADGHQEYFGAGTNLHVYHIVPGWSDWNDLGGRAIAMLNAFYNTSSQPTVQVRGTDYLLWCSSWTGSSWNRWHRC